MCSVHGHGTKTTSTRGYHGTRLEMVRTFLLLACLSTTTAYTLQLSDHLVADKAFATKEWVEWSNYTVGCSRAAHGDRGIALTHIPRTAGSMLEALGAMNGVCWGRFLRHRDSTCGETQAKQCVGPWFHQPPRGCVPPSQTNFCVVRGPAERVVSAYRFSAKQTIMGSASAHLPKVTMCSAAALNDFVRVALQVNVHQGRNSSCHLMPHSKFDCNVWLNYEALPSSFNTMMNQSGMSLRIHDWHINEGACATITALDLDAQSESLIREVYHDDLQLLHRVRVHGGLYEPPS